MSGVGDERIRRKQSPDLRIKKSTPHVDEAELLVVLMPVKSRVVSEEKTTGAAPHCGFRLTPKAS